MARIQIDVDLSRQGLLDLRSELDNLLRDLGIDDSAPATSELSLEADRKVGEVWGRVGDNIRRFLTFGAQLNQDGDEFSMDQVAAGLHVPVKTVRSWHRNLGRTLRQVDAAMPEPELMTGRWDGARNQYQFLPEVRAAILDRAGATALDIEPRAELLALESIADSTPAIVVTRAFNVLERRLRQIIAAANIELPMDDPNAYELIEAASRNGLISAKSKDALGGLMELRDLASHDPSGTRTTPAKARDFIAMAGATLYAITSDDSAE